MEALTVERLELKCGVGWMTTNGYLVVNPQNRQALVVDPAGEADKIARALEALEATPVAVLLTHAHFDHLVALGEVKQAYGIPAYAGAGEEGVFTYSMQRLQGFFPGFQPSTVDHWVEDGAQLALAGLEVRVIATSGHSRGSVCYAFEEAGVLMSGDTLFQGSIGRTDFPEEEMKGDHNVLMDSLHKLVDALPDGTTVYPGHGDATTIGAEKAHNPFLR